MRKARKLLKVYECEFDQDPIFLSVLTVMQVLCIAKILNLGYFSLLYCPPDMKN